MATNRNRFSLVLHLSAEDMAPSPSTKTGFNHLASPTLRPITPLTASSSACSIAVKTGHTKKGLRTLPYRPPPRPRISSNTEQNGGERPSLLRKVGRVLSRLPKVDATASTTTSDRGIDFNRFHSLHQSEMSDGHFKSPSTSTFLLPSPTDNTMPPRPMTSPGPEGRRLFYRRSPSQSALVDSVIGESSYSLIDDDSTSGPTLGDSGEQTHLTDSSNTGRRLRKARKRKSLLDLAQFSRSKIPATALPVENIALPEPVSPSSLKFSLKRSNSLWNRPGHVSSESISSVNEGFQSRYLQNFGVESPLKRRVTSERQKALNVKRAKKMAQVFGDEPPQELFQIAAQDDNDEDIYRISMASSLSLSSAFLLSIPHLSNTSDSTPLDSTELESEPESEPEPEPVQPPRRQRLETDLMVDAHPTPPPFSAYPDAPNSVPETLDDYIIPCADPAFHERRKRAAKLSKFFGVGYHQFTESVLPPPRPKQGATVHVDVRVNNRGWFWERDKPKPVPVSDVIGKLRELR